LTAADTGGSGIADTYYKINDGETKTINANGQPQITVNGLNNKLEYWSIDNAGNEESPHKVLTNIKLDTNPQATPTPSPSVQPTPTPSPSTSPTSQPTTQPTLTPTQTPTGSPQDGQFLVLLVVGVVSVVAVAAVVALIAWFKRK